ncbi:sn-glycerol-1-phosphate dehydrogenase [Acidipropionibacterium timonense]|uniref:sn-glycerol-1-phosphate dehydrogenase n=1 Tax=Acidipropionibacterium timonense TaxID=2161818 RepID=UPI00103067A4|nr:sn-glycerol-1-phosphate dehydrogenase [Acidipropionibacterium timonense]
MSDMIIKAALADARDTDIVEVGRGAVSRIGKAIRDTMNSGAEIDRRPVMLVADARTWRVAGEAVTTSLANAGVPTVEPLVFPATPTLYASLDNARHIAAVLRQRDNEVDAEVFPIAVGSGTINDLTKLAAKDLGRRYAVVGTAASMDGYTGAGAPISNDGVKVTMNCVAPQVVVFDLDLAARAPRSMTASGFGDLSAKIPGGADWLLADAAGVEPVDEHVWTLVQSGVHEALSRPAQLAAGVPEAYEGLVKGLILSGLAMQVYDGTRPASGAEHYFSHIWELAHLGAELDPPLSHGFKVAIGTLAMLSFYEKLLAKDPATIDIDAAVAAWPEWDVVESDIRSTFDGALADHAVKETKVKFVDKDGLRSRLERFVVAWPTVADRVRQQLVPAPDLAEQLRLAGAPSRPEDIGLTARDVQETFPKAMYYRSRYTVLDVAREVGWFDDIVADVFAPGGLWT